MPQSDTWPGGTGLELVYGMESAGSCDSVVSAHSGSSDDSLDHLSAEEKACLMFLEETIDSLDTEDDSGLSHDEPDQLPLAGSVASKVADLSALMSKTKINGLDEHVSKKPSKDSAETKLIYSCLVPTPFVAANGASCAVSSARAFAPLPLAATKNSKPGQKDNQKSASPPAPPSLKAQEYSGRAGDGPLPRGPLSYEALVHLRKSASAKKTPLCPTVDHTIDLGKPALTPVASNLKNILRSGKSHTEVYKSKTNAANAPVKAQTGSIPADSVNAIKHAKDPQVVRVEALQKLGLLADEELENDDVAALPQRKSNSSLDPMPNRFTRAPAKMSTSRSPSFCTSQVATEAKHRPLQSSASFHQYSTHDQQPLSSSNPTQSTGLRKSGMVSSASDDRRRSENIPEKKSILSAKSSKTRHNSPPRASASAPAYQNPSNVVGYTVMVVPGMGADRKEALRKLGLLKD